MPKKKSASHRKSTIPASKELRVEKALVENFVSLQKVMANLSTKFDHLSDRIDKLLDIFEISAKALAEKDFNFEKDNKDVLDKLGEIMEQNKTIARGLTLIHEIKPKRLGSEYEEEIEQMPTPKPIQPNPDLAQKIKRLFPGKRPMQMQNQGQMPQQGYQESITSMEKGLPSQRQQFQSQNQRNEFSQEIQDNEFVEY